MNAHVQSLQNSACGVMALAVQPHWGPRMCMPGAGASLQATGAAATRQVLSRAGMPLFSHLACSLEVSPMARLTWGCSVVALAHRRKGLAQLKRPESPTFQASACGGLLCSQGFQPCPGVGFQPCQAAHLEMQCGGACPQTPNFCRHGQLSGTCMQCTGVYPGVLVLPQPIYNSHRGMQCGGVCPQAQRPCPAEHPSPSASARQPRGSWRCR